MRKLIAVFIMILMTVSCRQASSEQECKKYIVDFRFASYEKSPLLKKEIFKGKELYIHNEILISNSDFSKAIAHTDEYGRACIRFTLNSEGKEKLSRITSEKYRMFLIAILINDRVNNAVTVRDQINTGKGLLTGSFSEKVAHDIAECLNKSWYERLFK